MATSQVHTYTLTPEELERYRNMGKPKPQRPTDTVGNFQHARDEYFRLRAFMSAEDALDAIGQVAFWCGLAKDTVKTLIPKWEAEIMGFELTMEQYLEQRLAGKSRADIAKEQGIGAPGLLYHLAKWGIKESVREEREMDKLVAAQPQSTEVAVTVERDVPPEADTQPKTTEATPEAAADTVDEMERALAQSPYAKLEALSSATSEWFKLDTSNVEDATEKLRAFEEQVTRTIEALQTLRDFFSGAVAR